MPVDYLVVALPVLFIVLCCFAVFGRKDKRRTFVFSSVGVGMIFVGVYMAPEWISLHKAKKGDVDAQVKLAYYYWTRFGYLGSDCYKRDHWFLKAAESGHPQSMAWVGHSYIWGDMEYGGAIPKDHKKARAWLERAASMGNADAKGSLKVLSKEEGSKRR